MKSRFWSSLPMALLAAAAPGQTPPAAPKPLAPRTDGVIHLDASAAAIHGKTARFQVLQGLGNICYWTEAADWLSWEVALPQSGAYVAEWMFSCAPGSEGSEIEVALGDRRLAATLRGDTGSWDDHEVMKLGAFEEVAAGPHTVTVRPLRKPGHAVMNLVWLRLVPAADYEAYLTRCAAERDPRPIGLPSAVFVVPNFHPASCGWLAHWSVERNYCANSYLDHLDRVRDDANYRFAMSECNNMIAIRDFRPERFAELQRRVKEGRVELVNAFFLESTINLSGGEALARMGLEGLRWQREVMGVRPRFCWTIDVCGTHAQMPQLCRELGLEALVYTRCNRSGKSVFWSESPDGSRVLTLVPGHYSDDFGGAYAAAAPLTAAQLKRVARAIADKTAALPTGMERYGVQPAAAPVGAPLLILGGRGDYSLAPARRENPSEFLAQWEQAFPACPLRYTGLSAYVDALRPLLDAGKLDLPVVRTGTGYTFDSFWIQCPRVKTWYRRNEHALQTAEALASVASLSSAFEYPVQPLNRAWIQMLLNMDRNTLWGAAGGMVFEHPESWDAKDRLEWVEKRCAETSDTAIRTLAGRGEAVALFNPLTWPRTDPVRLRLPEGRGLAGGVGEAAADGTSIWETAVPAMGVAGLALGGEAPPAPKAIAWPAAIETRFYSARVDPATGALRSLRTKPSGRERLGGAANVIVAEKHCGHGDPGDFTDARPKRTRLSCSTDLPATVTAVEGPLAITVTARGPFFGGGDSTRVIRFFKNHPRIEFETELNDVPDKTVVVAEFPLAGIPSEIRRGIPFGFSRDDGVIGGIVPAVRWSEYRSPGAGGVALLDRGLTGREIDGRVPVIYLLNAHDTYYGYPNAWLSGKGRHRLEYALVAQDAEWTEARVPQLAWEYNSPVILAAGCGVIQPQSFVQTSGHLVVEALHRDGADLVVRAVEALGEPGEAEVRIDLPHSAAAITDLTGAHARPLTGGPAYRFPVRPQQIVTLRFRTASPVPPVEPLLAWDELVPANKRAALREYLPDKKGHPPRGS